MNIIEPRLLKGFRDYDPAEQSARQAMFATIQSVFERFGFSPLSTPTLEYREILMGKYGEDEKLIYSFKDNGDRDVAMRYDLTVPLARYVAQNQNMLTLPFKRYQIAPVWRADNPQKGRYREFYQCDVDAVGTDSVLADAEVIACLCQAISALGVSGYYVRINNRAMFNGLSVVAIRAIDKIDKIGLSGVVEEMKNNGILDDEIERATTLIKNVNQNIPEAVSTVMDYLQQFGIDRALTSDSDKAGKVVYEPSIARGLDYYTGTVFEIMLTDKSEYGSICSGGRYDNLVDQYSKTSVPAVGGSLGIDRLFSAMTEMGLIKTQGSAKVMVFNLEQSLQNDYVEVVSTLRNAGISAELYYAPAKIDKQFKYAETKNIQYGVIMGQTEKDSGKVQLKNLATREQKEVLLTDLVGRLQ